MHIDAGAALEYLLAAGHNVAAVKIVGDDPQTWTLSMRQGSTQDQEAAALAALRAYDPSSQAAIDAARDADAAREARRHDVLALCAVVAKYTDPAGWAAMTTAQRVARVRAVASDFRTFRVFVEAQGV